MWRRVVSCLAVALAVPHSAEAFVIQAKFELGRPGSYTRTRSSVCSTRGWQMQIQEEEAVNREQRRMMKKSEKRRQAGANSKGFTSPQEGISKISEVMTEKDKVAPSTSGLGMAPPDANRPKTMEDLRKESNAGGASRAVAKAEKENTKKAELLGYEEMKQIDPSVLAKVERVLLGMVLVAGGTWVLAGLCVSYDAYLVASKKELPAGFDAVLINYVEPFLTPGIVAIFLLSGLLGVLQFYKFEGGKTGGTSKLNEARRLTDASKRRNERTGGPLR